jgi:hypothetical protein
MDRRLFVIALCWLALAPPAHTANAYVPPAD